MNTVAAAVQEVPSCIHPASIHDQRCGKCLSSQTQTQTPCVSQPTTQQTIPFNLQLALMRTKPLGFFPMSFYRGRENEQQWKVGLTIAVTVNQ